jgi:RHS repeat-associated protein
VGRTEFTATTSASGGVHRPYTDTSYAKEYDLTGNAARTRYRKVMQDTYGNITSTYERVAAGIVAKDSMVDGENLPAGQFERKVDIPTFSHDVSGTNWLISRPTRSETYARSGDYPNEAVTRVTAMEYVTGTNRVGYITQEPDSGQESYRLRTDFGYDPYGNVNSVTLSSPGAGVATIETRTTSTDYSASADNPVAGRFPQQVMDGLGQKMTLVYDAVTGQLRKSKDEATGLETTWDYDAFGVQTLETRPDTTTTTTTYRWDSTSVAMENGSSVTAKYHVDVRNSGAPPALRRYDALGLPIQRITIAGDGASRFSETRYDDRNNVVAASRPHTATGTFYWTTTDYDAFNRPITRHVPAPPPPGSAAGASSTRDTFSWSYLGLAVTESDARALGTTRTANALGFAASMENNPTFAAGAPDRSKLTYKYDGFGNLREAIDAANNTVNTTYDRLGRKTQVVDPNMGTWNYAYYANGLLRTQTDAKTSTATFTYDKLDRPKDKTIGNRVTSWTYKINASTTPLNGARQLEQATATEGGNQIFQQTWTYDGQSRVSGTTRSFGGKSYAFGQTYDSAGRPWVNTYPSSDGASFATIQNYSALGFLKEVRRYDPSYTGNLGQIYWQAADYEEDGQLRMAYIGNGAAVDRMHYAENGRPAGDGISVNPPHGSEELPPLLLQSYGFDGVGNLTSRGVEFTKADGNPASYTETFTYDGMNRVQYVDHSTAGRTNTYLYNSIGNLTSKDGHAFDYTRTVNTEPLAPHAVRSALGATYTYDASGNLTGNSAGTTVTWRTFNQPDRITRGTEWSEFTYGADDERIIQTTQNGTQTRYVGSLYEVTVPQGNASLTEVRAYVMTPLGRTAVVQFNGGASAPTSTRYLTQDQITSTSLVTDEAGRARERFSYDPWGAPRHAETLATSNAWPDRQATTRGFTDHEMLSRLQLVHMNGRIYNPTLGRFMSPDPFVNDADGTQMLNRYAYVRNNPLSLTDPSGYQVASTSSAGSEIVRGDTVVVRGDRVPTTTWKPFNPSVGVTTGVGANTTSGATLNHSAPNSEGSYFDDEAYAIYRGDIIAGRRPLTDEDIWFDPTLLSDVAYRRAAVVMKQSAETAVDWSHVGPFYDGVQAVTGHDLEGERVSRAEKGIKVAINIGVGKVVAIVGTAVGVVVKYAIRFHHPWPMYLRGKIQQILEPLPKDVHDAYHNGLDKFLPRQASDGVNRGKAVYDNMSDADIREVFRKLEAYTKDFDVKNNTHLWDAMRREGFPGNP